MSSRAGKGRRLAVLLLIVMYLSYISLGLPDSLLGATWHVMQPALHVPLSYAGILSAVISCGTVLSSLLSGRLLRRFRTGQIAACSVMMTAAALWGFSAAERFAALILFAVPYGLGAGAVDAALNHYTAVHFPARHMNWLHSFWGIGCMLSPYIVSIRLQNGWQSGYRTVAVMQGILTLMLIFSLPLWKQTAPENAQKPAGRLSDRLRNSRGIGRSLAGFFSECALESTAGLWASSYLALRRGVGTRQAACAGALFYAGITLGRLLGGALAERLGDRKLIGAGLFTTACGIALLMLPRQGSALCGLLVIGLGCAPVYPCQLHEAPSQFRGTDAQTLIGMQMACAYLGTTLVPPLFGLLSGRARAGLTLFPMFLTAFLALTALLRLQDPE